jgi:hypothetical protein
MKIGYARVSTLDQNLDLQLQALKKAGCHRIFQEKISGSNPNRPEFRRMLDHIREDDIIVVCKLDRLARSTRDLLETMETIRVAGGRFQSISEPWADTTSHAGKMIMTIFAGIAEFERDLIRERTGAGREAAKKRGVQFGRPRKLALAGVFNGFNGGTVIRSCSVPEGAERFFPVINDIEINTPNVCGSLPTNVSVRDLRATVATRINGAINLSVTLDGKTIKDLRRVKSEVFGQRLGWHV